MEYNKDSFLTGIAIGRTLKGWASAGKLGNGESGPLSNITVRSGTTDIVEIPAEGFYGIGRVNVQGSESLIPSNIKAGVKIFDDLVGTYAPPPIKLANISTTITRNGSFAFTPTAGSDGLGVVNLTVDVPVTTVVEKVDANLQSIDVDPKPYDQTVGPTGEYNALSSVTVRGYGEIDPADIRFGAEVLGVQGAFVGTLYANPDELTVTPKDFEQTFLPILPYNTFSKVTVRTDSNLIPSNIRQGISIFGVEGSYSNGTTYQTKTITPTSGGSLVTPDGGYDALDRVYVSGDRNLAPENIAKGAKIFGVTGTYVSPTTTAFVVPSVDEQKIIPPDGFVGFSSVSVAPVGALGSYGEGYAAGIAASAPEIEALQAQVAELIEERNAVYDEGYDAGFSAGYDEGASDAVAAYKNLDEEEF